MVLLCCLGKLVADERPNVIVIMSDDQGVGDYGFQGNPVIRTPQLDAMRTRSGLLSKFYVSPVCAPTRACLMTGRYNYRTRCIDTYIGRAMMDTDEVTMAEFLRDAGYQTGIYGKWHLGDNYPLRAMDQGFQDSLVHRGGGIGQPSDPVGAEGKYTDPTLIKNGVEVPMKGYCTDLYFDAAMDFISKSTRDDKKFFTYIATNAPHGPFHDVPQRLYEEYRNVDFTPILINRINPGRMEKESDKLARIAAMITNIDENVGRLFGKLDSLGITENTIVVYLNDNGPNSSRFVGQMRGRKAGVDDGGIRSPLLFQWPAKVLAGRESNALSAHIDLLPTILEACGVDLPKKSQVDGRSFLSLLTGTGRDWPTRQIVLQTHRGDQPQLYHHFAIHQDPWKLVHPSGFGKERFEGEPKLELYNLKQDPKQSNDVAAVHPEMVANLKKSYVRWFKDVSSTRPDNFSPPRIIVGTDHEPRSVLTRQDWRHFQGQPWSSDSNGSWLIETREEGLFEVELIVPTGRGAGVAKILAGEATAAVQILAGNNRHKGSIRLPQGPVSLKVEIQFDDHKSKETVGPHQIILVRR